MTLTLSRIAPAAALLLMAALSAHAESLTCVGVLGNSGEQGKA